MTKPIETAKRRIVKTKVVKPAKSKHNRYVYGIVRITLPQDWINKRVRIIVEQQP